MEKLLAYVIGGRDNWTLFFVRWTSFAYLLCLDKAQENFYWF